MRIAIDALGGDHAPAAMIEGALRVAKEYPNTRFVLIGQDESIVPNEENIEFKYVSQQIEANDEPVRAVRAKKDSSIVVGCQLLREKEVDAFISAGNTGALMAAGLFVVKRLKGVDRPALAAVFPTLSGRGVLVLDVGANVEAKPEHLHQYACMGSVYAEQVLGIENPRIGLLNVGTEASKGNELTKATYLRLQNESSIHFLGNIEARDVLSDACDVLVCDGFSGNLLLKATEGVVKGLFHQLKKAFTRNLSSKLAAAVLRPGLMEIKKKMDYKEHGGAPLLGLQRPVIKAHGSSDGRAIYNAIVSAHTFCEQQVIEKIEQGFNVEKEVD